MIFIFISKYIEWNWFNENFNVKEYNNKFAYINIKYYGKINKIKEKLVKRIDIKFDNNQWSARLK